MMKRSKLQDRFFFILLIGLALAGIGCIIHTAIVVALGTGSPDQPLRFITGFGLIALSAIFWICFAITGGRTRWQWAERVSDKIRAKHEEEMRLHRQAEMDYLASLSPEEREKEVDRLMSGESVVSMDIPDKESFLHPRNWPYDRVKPGCFD